MSMNIYKILVMGLIGINFTVNAANVIQCDPHKLIIRDIPMAPYVCTRFKTGDPCPKEEGFVIQSCSTSEMEHKAWVWCCPK